jgi:membrane-associated phospholipid phosphatase
MVLFIWLATRSARAPYAAYGSVLVLGTAFLFAYMASYAIAILWPHVRPIDELPRVKELFATLGTWKSFPSDHTIAVTIIASTAIYTSAPIGVVVFFVLVGLGVACGRVYAGVHYPRDIIGGLVFGVLATWLAFQVLYGA